MDHGSVSMGHPELAEPESREMTFTVPDFIVPHPPAGFATAEEAERWLAENASRE